MGRNEEALVAAERCKARITLDSLYNSSGLNNCAGGVTRKTMVTCSESIFDIVNKSKTNIIYFSLVGDELYAWFLQPQKRIVRFHVAKLNEYPLLIAGNNKLKNIKTNINNVNNSPIALNTIPTDTTATTTNTNASGVTTLNTNINNSGATADINNDEPSSILEQYVKMVRDSLGVNSENVLQEGDGSGWRSTENLLDDFTNERAGFLRMVNRNQLLNSSNYSLSSLFSLGSVGGSVASLQGSTRLVFIIF